MISRFHKTEFYTSILILAISVVVNIYGFLNSSQLHDSTMDMNVHDPMGLGPFSLVLITGLINGILLLIFSNKKYNAYKGLYIINAIAFMIWVYSIIQSYQQSVFQYMIEDQNPFSRVDTIDFYNNLVAYLIPFLILSVLTIIILKIIGLRKTNESRYDEFEETLF